MGHAAYLRGNRVISAAIERELSAARNTLDARAQLWCALLKRGCILTFRAGDGAILTAGPHQTAVDGGGAPKFALYRERGDPRRRGEWVESAWSLALRITDNVGRVRPITVVE